MSRANGLSGMGRAQSVAPRSLQRISSGWVDQELVTVRKMAKDGATAEEIADALGWKKAKVISYIRRNRLVWNNHHRNDPNRHIIASAAAIGTHMKLGHKIGGSKREKLTAEQRTEAARRAWATRRANGNAPPLKADRDGMLSLIIRLHVEEVLSEGQVAKATGLDRPEIRRLADECAAPTTGEAA